MSKFTKEEKRSMIKAWKTSSKNMSQWSKEHNIPKSTFYTWVKCFSKKEKMLDIKKFIETPIEPQVEPQVLSEIKIVVKGISISISQRNI